MRRPDLSEAVRRSSPPLVFIIISQDCSVAFLTRIHGCSCQYHSILLWTKRWVWFSLNWTKFNLQKWFCNKYSKQPVCMFAVVIATFGRSLLFIAFYWGSLRGGGEIFIWREKDLQFYRIFSMGHLYGDFYLWKKKCIEPHLYRTNLDKGLKLRMLKVGVAPNPDEIVGRAQRHQMRLASDSTHWK